LPASFRNTSRARHREYAQYARAAGAPAAIMSNSNSSIRPGDYAKPCGGGVPKSQNRVLTQRWHVGLPQGLENRLGTSSACKEMSGLSSTACQQFITWRAASRCFPDARREIIKLLSSERQLSPFAAVGSGSWRPTAVGHKQPSIVLMATLLPHYAAS